MLSRDNKKAMRVKAFGTIFLYLRTTTKCDYSFAAVFNTNKTFFRTCTFFEGKANHSFIDGIPIMLSTGIRTIKLSNEIFYNLKS